MNGSSSSHINQPNPDLISNSNRTGPNQVVHSVSDHVEALIPNHGGGIGGLHAASTNCDMSTVASSSHQVQPPRLLRGLASSSSNFAGRGRTSKRKSSGRSRQQSTTTIAMVPQAGDRCDFCGEHFQRWGSHVPCSAPCGHVFGEVCLLQHVQHALAQGKKAECPCCRGTLRKGVTDVWRLYVANQDERTDSPARVQARVQSLETERQVELRQMEAALERVAQAEQQLAAMPAPSVTSTASPSATGTAQLQ